MQSSHFKKNFIYTVLYKTLLIVAPLVTAPYLSRVLGPEKIGIQSYCQSIAAVFDIFATLGIATYGERQIAYHRDSKQTASRIFWSAKLLTAILSSVTIMCYLIFSVNSKYKIISLIFTLDILSNAINCTWVFHGFDDFGVVTLLSALAKIFDVVFIFLFVKSPQDIGIHILGTLLFPIIAEIIAIFFLRKHITRVPVKDIHPFTDFGTIISLFIPTIAVTLYSVLDKTMLGTICATSLENGYYEQASKVAGMSAAVIGSVAVAGFPDISYYWRQGKTKELRETMGQSYRMVWAFGFPLMFGLIGVADNIVPWFFGENYNKVIVLIKILSGLAIPLGISAVSGAQYLVATGKQKYYTISCIFSLVINFVLNIILIRKWQSVGASIASVAAEVSLAVAQGVIVLKEQKYKTLFSDIWKYASSGILMLIVLLIENKYLESSASNTILMIFSGIVTYVSSLIFIKDQFIISMLDSLFVHFKRPQKTCPDCVKVAFFQTSIPEYRYKLFEEISNLCNSEFIVEDIQINEKIYGNKFDTKMLERLNITENPGNKELNRILSESTHVVIQTPDNLSDIFNAYKTYIKSKHFNCRTYLFWERWNPEGRHKTYSGKVKEIVHDLMVSRLARSIDFCLASGTVAKKYFMYLGVRESRIKIVGDCSSLPECEQTDLRAKYNIPQEDFVFLYLGRLIERKGIMLLLKAYTDFIEKNKINNCWLVIGGDGPVFKKVQEYINNFPDSKIILTGYVSQATRKNFFDICNAFVLPSYFYGNVNEAWGLTINEAMSLGKPVISTTACGAAFDLINKETGIMVQENSIPELEEALYTVYRTKYNSDGIKKFISSFSEEAVAKNVVNSFKTPVIINGRFLLHRVTGVERYAREIVTELDKLAEPDVIEIAIPKGVNNVIKLNNIKIVQTGILNNRLWEHISFPRYVRRKRAVSLNLCNVAPLSDPGIVCIHDVKIKSHPEFFTKKFVMWYNFLFRNEVKKAKKIITVSEFSKREIIKYYKIPDSRIDVIPDAWQHYSKIKFDEKALEKYNLEKGKYFFAIGSIDPNKNFKWIAETAIKIPDNLFVIAGNINKTIFKNDSSVKFPDNIKLIGYVSDEEAKTLMRDCLAFLFPSIYEGFGMPPLEAMSCGCKNIMVSDTEVMHEIFGDSVQYLNINEPLYSFAANNEIDTTPLQRYSWKESAKLLFKLIQEII